MAVVREEFWPGRVEGASGCRDKIPKPHIHTHKKRNTFVQV